MKETIKLAILGGDERQILMAKTLAEKGYSVAAWGLGEVSERLYPATVFEEWKATVWGATAIVLPLPMTEDGIRIRSPLHHGEPLRWQNLLEEINPEQRIMTGKPDEAFLRSAEERDVKVIDYFGDEGLQLKNAMVTAEGAISLAMKLLPVTLYGCETAVIGYGRIGKFLADRLQALGASVTVYARRAEVLVQAELNRCRGRLLEQEEATSAIPDKELSSYRVIFNTVPCRLLERKDLQRIPKDCLLMDLASVPGGFDHKAAEELERQAVWATALPGKYAPESAGRILAETVDGLVMACQGNGMQS